MRVIFAAPLAFMVAACPAPHPVEEEADLADRTQAGATEDAVGKAEAVEFANEGSEGGSAEKSTPPAENPDKKAAIANNRIPAAFQGVWDYVDGTCSTESDLRMEIAPEQIIYYESLGQVRLTEAKGEMSVDVTLAMEGEGEEWETVQRLTLSKDGNTLTPSAGPGEQAFEPMPRKKCPQ